MPRRRVVPVVEIAMEFPALTRNPRLIVPNVPPVPPVAIFGKHGSRSHSDQQQNPSYHAFHIPFPFRSPQRSVSGSCSPEPVLMHANPVLGRELRGNPYTIVYTATVPSCFVDLSNSSRWWHLGFESAHLTYWGKQL